MSGKNKMDKIKPTTEEIVEDLEKFAQKCNAMMLESARGPTPQLIKITLLKKLVESWFERAKETKNLKEHFLDAEKLIDCFIEDHGSLTILEGEDAKKEIKK